MPTRVILNDPSSSVSGRNNARSSASAPGAITGPLDFSLPHTPPIASSKDIRGSVSAAADLETGRGRPIIQQELRNVKFLTPTRSIKPSSPPPPATGTGRVDIDDENNSFCSSPHKRVSGSTRKTIKLRSSLFHKSTLEDEQRRALSKDDIRASARLLGYLFQTMTSVVMLISVLKFFFDGERTDKSMADIVLIQQANRFWITPLGPVLAWKLFGCITMSGVGTILSILIIVVHFDTIAFPDVWKVIFQDGSRYEQYLCFLLVLYWAAALHINTSTLSVGEVQANVFFTTWIAFLSSVLNCGVWRISAGRRSIAEFINEHPRETTFNWLWTFFFASVCAGAMTSTYANRKFLTFKFLGEPVSFSQRDWTIILTVLWGFVVICVVALILNHFLKKSCEIRVCKGRLVLLGWRQIEGVIALGVAGTFFYLVFTYTGVDGFINGLNNTYFGLWGTFINSVFLLATWLRENKNIDIIKKEEKERTEKLRSFRFRK